MSEEGKVFKISCFGGFKKEEVLSYIQTAAEDYQQKIEDLECTIAALERERDSACDDAAELTQKNKELAQKNSELLQRLSEMTLTQEKFQKEIEEKTEEAQIFSDAEDELRHRVDELESQVSVLARDRDAMAKRAEKLEAQSEGYRLSKEKLSEIELSAYKRAQDIEDKALLEAKNVRIQSAQLISAVKKKIQAFSEDYSAYIDTCSERLNCFKQDASNVLDGMNDVIASLDETMVGELEKGVQDSENSTKRPTMADVIHNFESGKTQDGTL